MMNQSNLPRLRFDTAALPAAEQFDAWQSAVGVTHDVAPRAPTPTAGFAAEADIWMLGQTLITSGRFDAQRFVRPAIRARRDGIDHYSLLLTHSGGWTGTAGEAERRVGPGEICLLDLARPMASEAAASASLCLLVPRGLLDAALPPGNLHGLVLQGGAGALLAAYLRLLAGRLDTLSAEEAPLVEQATLGMIAACVAPSRARIGAAAEAIDMSLLAAARREIETRLTDPALSPDSLAASLRLSRSALYRLFAPLGGVAGYIQARRLARVRALLGEVRPGQRIADIAFAYGFANQAHFTRAFRAAFGISPGAYRATLSGRGTGEATGGVDATYHRWVRAG